MTDNDYETPLRVKKDTHREVKILAARLGLTIDETVKKLLEEYHRHTALGRRHIPLKEEA